MRHINPFAILKLSEKRMLLTKAFPQSQLIKEASSDLFHTTLVPNGKKTVSVPFEHLFGLIIFIFWPRVSGL
jgi:hypothetical protein